MNRLYDYRYYNLLSYLLTGGGIQYRAKRFRVTNFWLAPEARVYVSVALIMANFDGLKDTLRAVMERG